MGIGYFYKWLTEKYPKVVRDSKTTIMEYDCLYVDMNPIIHECFHPEDPKVLTFFLANN
jgi:5'-3' exonuclease